MASKDKILSLEQKWLDTDSTEARKILWDYSASYISDHYGFTKVEHCPGLILNKKNNDTSVNYIIRQTAGMGCFYLFKIRIREIENSLTKHPMEITFPPCNFENLLELLDKFIKEFSSELIQFHALTYESKSK